MRVIQANLAKFVSHNDLTEDVLKIINNANIIGVNEVSQPHDINLIEAILEAKRWRCSFREYNPQGNGVIWNPALYEAAGYTERLIQLPGVVDRSVVRQNLIDKQNRKLIRVLSTHLTPKAFTTHPERRDEWKKGMAVVAEMFRESNADLTILTGDLNCNFLRRETRRFVTRPMPRKASYDMLKEPTFGSALYDYIVSKGPVKVLKREIYRSNSDHHFPMVRYHWL